MAHWWKNLPANSRDAGSISDSERIPGEGNGPHSSIHACEIPWTEELGGVQSMELHKSWTSLSNKNKETNTLYGAVISLDL